MEQQTENRSNTPDAGGHPSETTDTTSREQQGTPHRENTRSNRPSDGQGKFLPASNCDHCSADSGSTASRQDSSCASKPDLMAVLKQTPTPPVLCDWLVCLRKPALSMQYSIQRKHIPDLDALGRNENGAQPQGSSASTTPTSRPGVNSDTMGVKGDFTIRYLDLAAGVLAMVAAGCLVKGCLFFKRNMF